MSKKSQWMREDDFNPTSKFENQFQEQWIHKKIVKITGDTEDDFVLEEKPVLIDKVNIFKSIQEEAKTTDLKELLKQFAATGDESIFNKRQGFYADVTGVQKVLAGESIPSAEEIKESLPEEFKDLSVEELVKMTDADIVEYFKQVRAQREQKKQPRKEVKEEKEKSVESENNKNE